jgi:hypothetical protein
MGLRKKVIKMEVKAKTHFQIGSETEPEVTHSRMEREIAKLKKMGGSQTC